MVQAAFLSVMRKAAAFDLNAHFPAWASAILRFKSLDALWRAKRSVPGDEDFELLAEIEAAGAVSVQDEKHQKICPIMDVCGGVDARLPTLSYHRDENPHFDSPHRPDCSCLLAADAVRPYGRGADAREAVLVFGGLLTQSTTVGFQGAFCRRLLRD
jgi:hypothetical protein